jgi:hypothetical protein
MRMVPLERPATGLENQDGDASASGVRTLSHPPTLMQGQAPGAKQAHNLLPRGKVGSIPTPATNVGKCQ